ncbi:hypothetical protein [Xanthobacter autotrophicus]|uniref:hypothetical protein n=1 Tax=Xanthobacter autotrophicus TaxID=280 RepID=UPI00372A8C4B
MNLKLGATMAATVLALNAVPAFAASQTFQISRGTEHKVATAIGPGGEKLCFTVRDPQTKAPALGHFRRTLNGHGKDLDRHFGGRCLETKPGVYVVYVTAVDQDIEVVFHSNEVHDWRPGPPDGNFRMERIAK